MSSGSRPNIRPPVKRTGCLYDFLRRERALACADPQGVGVVGFAWVTQTR